MFDWVPIELYTPIYYGIMLFLVLMTFFETQATAIDSDQNFRYMRIIGWIYLVFVTLYIGSRQYSGIYFGDTYLYRRYFIHYQNGGGIVVKTDLLFHLFTQISSKLLTLRSYFILCAILYVIPLFIVSKKWFKDYWFYGLLFLITAFSFWAYGVNGVRNGIAGSFFLLGMSREKRLWQILWIILAIGFHKSMVLPTAAFILANFYNQPKKLIYIWLLCIPLSLAGGGFFESFFGSLGFEDDRVSYLAGENINKHNFSSTGFRWDFLLYSATGVFAGWFFIFKRNFKDKIYFWLFNTYILTNAFWILVIRASFSNRFAYLSWFMISLVIIYPLLKQFIITKQHRKIGLILLAYFTFTFFMNILLVI